MFQNIDNRFHYCPSICLLFLYMVYYVRYCVCTFHSCYFFTSLKFLAALVVVQVYSTSGGVSSLYIPQQTQQSVNLIITNTTGRSGDRVPVGARFFRTYPVRTLGPTSLLYKGYRVYLGVKRPGARRWPSTPSSAKVKGRVELYLYNYLLTPLHLNIFIYEVLCNYNIYTVPKLKKDVNCWKF